MFMNDANSPNFRDKLFPTGPLWVALGALLWAFDAPFRSRLVGSYSVWWIVFMSHLLCLVVSAPVSLRYWRKWLAFRWTDWLALLVISIGGSISATWLFTYAFSQTSNYSIPILMQKLQPLIAVCAARIFLKEKLSRQFALVLVVALAGAVMIAWPNLNLQGIDPQVEFRAVIAAVGAALLWGICTVAGRHLTTQFGFLEMTALRYFVATIILLPLLAIVGEFSSMSPPPALDWLWFLLMAWGPGYLALVIYYKGLQGTRASIATLCELSFPVGAVLVNWTFLDSPLTLIQGLGALFLVGSVTWLSFEQAKTQKVGNVEVPFE